MGSGNGVSRGDRIRNARLDRLRAVVPVSNVIVAIDLAGKKQMVVVCDHDSKVLAGKTYRCRSWDLGAALDWAGERAKSNGFAGVTVSCEPSGPGGGCWPSSRRIARCRSCVSSDGHLVGATRRGVDARQDR